MCRKLAKSAACPRILRTKFRPPYYLILSHSQGWGLLGGSLSSLLSLAFWLLALAPVMVKWLVQYYKVNFEDNFCILKQRLIIQKTNVDGIFSVLNFILYQPITSINSDTHNVFHIFNFSWSSSLRWGNRRRCVHFTKRTIHKAINCHAQPVQLRRTQCTLDKF